VYAAADAAPAPGADAVILEINGAKLTVADLERKHAAALFQAQTNYYEAQRRVIEGMIDDYLLEQQARKEGLTLEQLLERHVNAMLAKDPSEETLRVYYEGVDTAEPFEAVRDKIVDSLRQRRMAKARTAYVQSLRGQMSIVLRLPPPRAALSMKNVPVRGAASPRVTLLEFADYECPYCQQIHLVLDRLEKEFQGKLAVAYKDYPLPMHPEAPKAAEAAHCAGAQGKYWEYHDTLFTAKQLAAPALKQYARELKLDTAAFDTCLDKGQMASVVNEQAAEAQAFGLPGTPAILINGRLVNGNLSYEKLHALIVEELNSTGVSADVTTRSQAHGAQ
jgi:protein-disulfide isomerase